MTIHGSLVLLSSMVEERWVDSKTVGVISLHFHLISHAVPFLLWLTCDRSSIARVAYQAKRIDIRHRRKEGL